VRLGAGEEGAGLSLDREVFGDAVRDDDGSITLKFGGVELLVARCGGDQQRLAVVLRLRSAPSGLPR
jgi:hypothetical protein